MAATPAARVPVRPVLRVKVRAQDARTFKALPDDIEVDLMLAPREDEYIAHEGFVYQIRKVIHLSEGPGLLLLVSDTQGTLAL